MPNLKEKYLRQVVPVLREEFSYKNDLAVPSLDKIVINTGLGKTTLDPKILEETKGNLIAITGQLPITTYAKKSIASFKLRKGEAIGLKLTLRDKKMYEFLDRLINIVLPRLRDFRGLLAKFDGKGNYTLGLSELASFPELLDKEIKYNSGLEVSIVTTAKTDKEGKRLLELLGFPFKVST